MGLHLVTGPANAGKTGVVHTALRSAVEAGHSAALLLPSEPDVRRARRELASDCPLGLTISVADSYLDGLWGQVADGRTIIGDVQRTLLLQNAIAEVHLETLRELARGPGFVRLVERAALRAAEAGVLRTARPARRGAVGEVLSILAGYGRALESQNLVEHAEAHSLLADRVPDLDLPDVIVANRFGSLTPQQERFLVSAARKVNVWVTLTWVEGAVATASSGALISRLRKSHELSEYVSAEMQLADPEEIQAIEKWLFEPEAGQSHGVTPSGAVVISEAWGTRAEAARIVREVQDALSDGIAPGEIAVVFRDPAVHAGVLRAALREAGIRAEFDMRIPLRATGIGRAITRLLRFFCAGGSRHDLIGFLRTPYAGCDQRRLDEMDALLRRRRAASVRELLVAVGEMDGRASAMIRQAKRLCTQAVGERSVGEWQELIDAMVATAYGDHGALDDRGELDMRAASWVIKALGEMSALSSVRFGAGDVLTLMRDASLALDSQERWECVQVMGAERMRGRRFAVVVLGGLNAQEFPKVPQDDALSAPRVNIALAQEGIDIAPRVDLDAERLLFYQVVTRARRRLVLSRQVADAEGRPLRPSPFLEELLDLYRDPTDEEGGWFRGGLPKRVAMIGDVGAGPALPLSERRRLRSAVAGEIEVGESLLLPRLRHAAWRSRSRTPCLSDPIRRHLEERTVFSASEIETYLACPYRWYVERVLRPESLESALDAGVTGRAAHEVMAAFYGLLLERTGRRRVTPSTLADDLQIHADVCEQVLGRLKQVGIAEEIAVRRVARATGGLVTDDANFLERMRPVVHEWGFGFGEDPAEQFDTFALKGRIDRIDAGEDGFVVIDYKTGSVEGKQVAKFETEGLVQLPLYAEVARRRLKLGRIEGAFYRSVMHSGKPRGFFLDGTLDQARFTRTDRCSESELQRVIEAATARAAEAVEGMRSGSIEHAPRGNSCPEYCPARGHCEGRLT